MGLFGGRPNVARLVAKEDVSGLVRALRHDDPSVRQEAASALGEILPFVRLGASRNTIRKVFSMHLGTASLAGIERHVGAWAVDYPVAANEREEAMRLAVVRMAAKPFLKKLRRLADPSPADGLVRALGDVESEVRRAAVVAVRNLARARSEARTGILGWHLPELEELADALQPSREIRALIEALSDSDDDVRKTAVEALEESGDGSAVPRLSEVAAFDVSPDVRAGAEKALARIEEREASLAGA
jgi:HEAT repeat protein